MYAIYFLSAIFSFYYIKALHSKSGKYNELKIDDTFLIFVTFVPVVNSLFSIMWLIKPPYIEITQSSSKDDMEEEKEILKYVNAGVYRDKIEFSNSPICVWSISRKSLVGCKDKPSSIELVTYGLLNKLTYENNRIVSTKIHEELTDQEIKEINESNGIIITYHTNFRFDFIPNK